MAMVAGGVANNGVVMQPFVVAEVLDGKGRRVLGPTPQPFRFALSARDAQIVRELMIAVVATGTGTAGQVPGVTVGGKTGTAQTGEKIAPHAWFIAFAPAEDPVVAVAVVVENGGSLGDEATGGAVAAPVARDVIQAVLTLRPDPGG
jgi:peptidoglycan glycosyltransferase